MSVRGVAIAGAAALAAVAGFLAFRGGSAAPPPTASASLSSLSPEEKARVREFWEVYREARALKLRGGWRRAIPKYGRALELDPEHEDSLYSLANCHFELDEFAEALGGLTRLVEVNPMSHRGFLQTGVIRSYPGTGDLFDLEEAETALLRAFEINKEETGSLLRLGELALVRGEDERAFELLALANQSNFRAVEGYYLRGYLRWKGNRRDASLELLREAVRQSRKPVVVAGVPGEGDTRPGSLLPPTTLDGKLLVRPRWKGLLKRYPDDQVALGALDLEFAPMRTYLEELRAR